MEPWWSDQAGNYYGGVAGAVVGVIGGIVGSLSGYLAPRGRARSIIYTMFAVSIGAGITTLVVGLFALTVGQPRLVWYPLVLCGGIMTLVFSCVFPGVRARYREAEMRRLTAEDLRRA